MKAYRSMVLVSSDPESLNKGADEVYQALQTEIKAFGLEDEISLTMVGDVGRHDAVPLVIVYPEAVIYGPVTRESVHYLVEEHLYKGRIASSLQAPVKELSGKIAWLTARKGTSIPAEASVPQCPQVGAAAGRQPAGRPNRLSSSASQLRVCRFHSCVRAAHCGSASSGRSFSRRKVRKLAIGPQASRPVPSAWATFGRWSSAQRSLLAP